MVVPYFHHRHRSVFSEFFNSLCVDLRSVSDKNNLQIVFESYALDKTAASPRSVTQKFSFSDKTPLYSFDSSKLDELCTQIDEFIHGCVLPLSNESIGSITYVKAYSKADQKLVFQKRIEIKSYIERTVDRSSISIDVSPARIRKREDEPNII